MVELSKELLSVILQHILPMKSTHTRFMVDIDVYSDAILKMNHECYDLNGFCQGIR